MTKRIVIFGAGGHSKVVADAIIAGESFEIAAVVDDAADRPDPWYLGLAVTSPGSIDSIDIPWAVVAIGDNETRMKRSIELENRGFRLATIVHPRSTVSPSAELGDGTVIFAGAVVNAKAVIGGCSIVNTASSVDHDCKLGRGVHVAPGARLAGEVHVGDRSLIGIGAVVLGGRLIGANAVVGAGAVVIENVGNDITVVGVPASAIERQI